MTITDAGAEVRGSGAEDDLALQVARLAEEYLAGRVNADDYFEAIDKIAQSAVKEEIKRVAERRLAAKEELRAAG
ncbi:hypothetical protein [Geodermatophilus africanus]|uniref:hypothetical protein n=1 Tax=Geodermatophilus africanus TaxID=1137993 RepID=UPI000B80F62D|nr:hypothetical protein [Geodermatophilus africanus]